MEQTELLWQYQQADMAADAFEAKIKRNPTRVAMKKNRDFIRTLKGGVIMDVTTPDEAKIAEDAGAVAVMALERVPADIRAAGGVARMSDPGMIRSIMEAVKIPVMAKCRIGHISEARILEAVERIWDKLARDEENSVGICTMR